MKKPQLFNLHFAGGNHYSFKRMSSFLADFEVVGVELPGRGDRMHEDLLKDFDAAASDLFNQIRRKRRGGDFLIYGHSMGAFLTLRIANMLSASNDHPLCMVVSGNAGPGIHRGIKRYLLRHEPFIDELRKLGGVPNEVLENKELLELFIPILRADFQIAEENGLENETPAEVPICAIMGEREEFVEEISNWKRFTLSGFSYKILPGGHFFVFDHFREVAGIIRDSFINAASLKR